MLTALLAKYSRIRLGTKRDNESILSFFSKVAMDVGPISLRYDRSPDFFAFLKVQGTHSVVFIMENDGQTIGGVGVVTSRECLVGGRVAVVSYLSDLRTDTKLSKRTRVQWRQLYEEIVENCREIDEFGNPEYLYSAILDDNKAAIRAFAKEDGRPRYLSIVTYKTINIFGRFTRIGGKIRHYLRANSKYQYRFATKDDYFALKEFLYFENSKKRLAYNFTKKDDGELERRLKVWPDFKLTDFFLALEGEKIVGCFAPWSGSTLRKLVVVEASFLYMVIGRILPLLGRDIVAPGKALNVQYITTIEVDSAKDVNERKEIFGNMIDELFFRRTHVKYHITSFFDYNGCMFKDYFRKKEYLLTQNEATLYQVLSPADVESNHLLSCNDGEIIGFDLGIA